MSEQKVTYSVRFHPAEYRAVDGYAEATMTSINSVVRQAVREFLMRAGVRVEYPVLRTIQQRQKAAEGEKDGGGE